MPASTLLRLDGRDALAVLHRISTQKLDDLAVGDARVTLFCDYRGRLLHRVAVARTNEAVWLIRNDAPGAPLAAHVNKHVFREDVKITDLSGTSTEFPAVLDLLGPADEVRRIEAGMPRHGHEISEEFTPFEVGIAHEVHLNKGCFTGQEVLLRLVTYKGQRRHLARVAGEGAAPSVPADLMRESAKVGRLTSAIAHGGGWIALAVVAKDLEGPEGLEVGGNGRLTRLQSVNETRPQGLPAA